MAIYYRLEYGEFDYPKDFHRSEQERQLDKLLSMFDSLAIQVESSLLKIEDLSVVSYEYLVTYRDRSVRDYLVFLDRVFEERGSSRMPYEAFRRVGSRLEEAEPD